MYLPLQELCGHAAESEGAVSLPAWSGRRHKVPLLQSGGHLCCARPLPQRLPLRLSCTACTVPGSASIFASTHSSLSDAHLCCLFCERLNGQIMCSCLAGVNALSTGPWILVEDLSSVYNDVEMERGVKHAHKKRKLADGREKTMVSTEQK